MSGFKPEEIGEDYSPDRHAQARAMGMEWDPRANRGVGAFVAPMTAEEKAERAAALRAEADALLGGAVVPPVQPTTASEPVDRPPLVEGRVEWPADVPPEPAVISYAEPDDVAQRVIDAVIPFIEALEARVKELEETCTRKRGRKRATVQD